ncbi:MAG TPA: DUF2975 domain-containing protein [Actinomycetes bacterium]|nr:DUF2975 domain-containing protein [Actinomycetes bacterium]
MRPTTSRWTARGAWIADFVAVLILLTGGLALIASVAGPINQLTQPGGTVYVTVAGHVSVDPHGLVHRLSPAVGPDVPKVTPDGSYLTRVHSADAVQLHVSELPWQLRLLSESAAALVHLCIAGSAWLLWGLLRSIGRNQPFDERNPKRLVALGVIAVVGGIGAPLLNTWATSAVLSHLGVSGDNPMLEASAPLNLTPIAAAMILFALATAFSKGGQLAEDVEGLV